MYINEETMLEAILALAEPGDLTADERGFVAELEMWRYRLNAFQTAKLRRIYDFVLSADKAREVQQ